MTRSRRCARSQAGFTMAELLVTLLILTVVLLGLAALQVNTIRQVTNSKLAGEATRLAQLVLERYKAVDYANIAETGGAWNTELQRDGVATMDLVGPDGEGDGPFTVRTMVESAPAGGSRLITVKVSWLNVDRVIDDDPTRQYRESSVTMSLQRFR